MDLFPLPPFYHEILVAMLVGMILLIWWRLRPKNAPKPPNDIYELSKKLQRLAPNDPKVKSLLEALAPYKYAPDAPKPPKRLLRQVQKYHIELSKKRYNRTILQTRSLHEKVRTFLRRHFSTLWL